MAALATDPIADERTRHPCPGHERVVRTYLDHHLPHPEREAALSEAFDEARHWGDTDLDDVLRCARRSLLARAVTDPEGEAVVLIVGCGLAPAVAAAVTGVDETAVRRAVNVRLAEELPPARHHVERTTPEAAPTDLDRIRRQERLTRVGIAVLLAVAVVSVIGLFVVRDADDPAVPATTGFRVAGLTVTDDPAATDTTDGPFPAGERVVVVIDYVAGDRDVTVDLTVVTTDGQPVLDTGVRLPRVRDRVHVPVPGRLLEEPGNYRTGVRRDGEVLEEVGFTVGQ